MDNIRGERSKLLWIEVEDECEYCCDYRHNEYLNKDEIGVQYVDEDELIIDCGHDYYTEFKINYCPMCGRKLND